MMRFFAQPQEEAEGVRSAAVAGRFYPGDPEQLRNEVRSLLDHAERAAPRGTLKALIVPHAGYIYSGPIAASAYAALMPLRDVVRTVVLIGPAHFVTVDGLATSSARFFATPLGKVETDACATASLAELPFVHACDDAHRPEHCLEVQLPFLQLVLSDFRIVPLLVGDASADQVAKALSRVWGGPETLFVISSDLSHYLDSVSAAAMDSLTAGAIEALAPDRIGANQACGRIPICGLLLAARNRNLLPHALDLRTSADTAGPRDRVVGYGAFVFTQ
jgi:AmmeMemoRadiSam system protein B